MIDNIVMRPRYALFESTVPLDVLPKSSGDYPVESLDKILQEAEIYTAVVAIFDTLYQEALQTPISS